MMNGENIIANYKVMYIGGLREYPTDPKFLKTQIVLNVFDDRLEFLAKDDFPGIMLPFEKILDTSLSRRHLQGTEFLGLGLFAVATKVMNNINIRWVSRTGNIQTLVFEMISGGTIWGTVKKCNELLSYIPVKQTPDETVQVRNHDKASIKGTVLSVKNNYQNREIRRGNFK